MIARWILFGGPCAGNYDVAESAPWPPPNVIRAVIDPDGNTAVLDLADDEPADGERVIEYELRSRGFMRGRGVNAAGAFATFYRVGLAPLGEIRAAGIASSDLEVVR